VQPFTGCSIARFGNQCTSGADHAVSTDTGLRLGVIISTFVRIVMAAPHADCSALRCRPAAFAGAMSVATPSNQRTRVCALRPPQQGAWMGKLAVPASGRPRSDQRRVLQPLRNGDARLVGRRDIEKERAGFGKQCAERQHQRRQHEHRHRKREDQRFRASTKARWQMCREPRVERPARDRRHTRREHAL
jgi:hypothetical protein